MTSFVPLLIFGAGKMGGAMLHGALKAGWPAADIRVIDPNPSDALRADATAHGFSLNPGAGAPAKLVLLAIKPQMLDSAATDPAKSCRCRDSDRLDSRRQEHCRSQARLPQVTKIVRAMPNTPAAIGRGITGAFASGPLSAAERDQVLALLRTTGGWNGSTMKPTSIR